MCFFCGGGGGWVGGGGGSWKTYNSILFFIPCFMLHVYQILCFYWVFFVSYIELGPVGVYMGGTMESQ